MVFVPAVRTFSVCPASEAPRRSSGRTSTSSLVTTTTDVTPSREERNWSQVALCLVSATLLYNLAEAGVSIWAGVDARSVALIGFGLDSIIESAAAIAVLFRVLIEVQQHENRSTSEQTLRLERVERNVGRFVGVTFFLLAVYVTAQSVWVLATNESPEESLAGIIIAAVSLVIMPLVAWGKIRAATKIGSSALRAEAKETLACSYLSFTLLVGLVFNALFGWWQADPVAALLMVPWLLKEGAEGVGCIQDDD